MKRKINAKWPGVAACAFTFIVAWPARAEPAATKTPAAKPEAPLSGMSYLDNGKIKIGVDLNVGGAITFLAKSGANSNLVNSFDWGRQIQMSHYSGPVPFAPNGKQPRPEWAGLGWNPIQSGDAFGHRARVLAHKNDGKTMYTKCLPMQWPLNNVPGDCIFETWISLDGNTARVHSRLNNYRADTTQYPGRDQELPAVYSNGEWYRVISYGGNKPFTDAPVTDFGSKWPPEYVNATEHWAALVDKNDFGLGVYFPGNFSFNCGFAGTPGAGGAKDNPTGYISPNYNEIIDHNIVYDFNYALIVGTMPEIRQRVYQLSSRDTAPPNSVFARDRQDWIYANAVDSGWPIRGELNIKLEQPDPNLIGPAGFWDANTTPKLYVVAALKSDDANAQVFWKTQRDNEFTAEKSASFSMIGDGQFRVYQFDLSKSPEYKGFITGLRFDPIGAGKSGEWIRIKSIGFAKPLASTRAP